MEFFLFADRDNKFMSDREKLYFYDSTKRIYLAVNELDEELRKLKKLVNILDEQYKVLPNKFSNYDVRIQLFIEIKALRAHIIELEKASKMVDEEDIFPDDNIDKIDIPMYNLLLLKLYYYNQYYLSVKDWVKSVTQRNEIHESSLTDEAGNDDY